MRRTPLISTFSLLAAVALAGPAAAQILEPTAANRAVAVHLEMYDSFWREYTEQDDARESTELEPFAGRAESATSTLYQFCDGWSEQNSTLDDRGLVAQMACFGEGADYDRGDGQADALSSNTLEADFNAPAPLRLRIHALYDGALDAEIGAATVEVRLNTENGERYQLMAEAPWSGAEAEWRGWVAAGNVTLNAVVRAEVVASRWLDAYDPAESATASLELELRGFCPGDFNCDEVVDGADAAAYREAWLAGDPAADVDASGTVDERDAQLFRGAYRRGCE